MTQARQRRPRVFSIPPHADFLATLAWAMRQGILPGNAASGPMSPQQEVFPAFEGWRIYLPTRRAARTLAAAMLQGAACNGMAQTCMLPRIMPLGDVDEDELALTADGEAMAAGLPHAELPAPAIAPLPRLFLLAELMLQWAQRDDAGQWRLAAHLKEHPAAALRMARSLARLIDSFENEGVPLSDIDILWSETDFWPERPEHRLAAQHLLQFLADVWPRTLARHGLTGAAARRAELIRLHARQLRAQPPQMPVIAAGSTGSMPATAELLSTIACLPSGCVVLPGLDIEMDDESWQKIAPGHPQFGMKKLLEEHIGADRREVTMLQMPSDSNDAGSQARSFLLREALRPVETTDKWRHHLTQPDAQGMLHEGSQGLHLLTASTRRQEALAIALLMRETLQTPGRTCMLITPDRTLARAVRAELQRWDVLVDDSAGQPLIDTTPAVFLKLLMDAALEDFSPLHLMALLRHPLACFGMQRVACARAADDLELAVLRPLHRLAGLQALPKVVAERLALLEDEQAARHEHPNARHMGRARRQSVERLAGEMAQRLAPLVKSWGRARRQPAVQLLATLLEVAENITTEEGGDVSRLWQGEAGEALAAALAEILAEAEAAPTMRPADLASFLETELAARVVRPHQPAHARLSILGLLEARLLRADRIILGGLNEGIWPEVTQNDPWLNRSDREKLHLPVPERRMGLSAHDFVQAASGRDVWLTCSERIGQEPAEPSRWIVRLQAVLQAAGLTELLRRETWPLQVAAQLDMPRQAPQPVDPPQPAPPVHLRPQSISASRVRTLLRDPYAVFARHILGLQALPPLSSMPTPQLFGIMVHAALEEFVQHYPRELPADAAEKLLQLLERKHAEHIGDEAHLAQVRGRLRRMAEAWVQQCEEHWHASGALLQAHAECNGRMTLDVQGAAFGLSARADRVDVLANGTLRIIDYKTGTLPARNPASAAYDPQMDLEAAIAFHGGFVMAGDVREVGELVLARLSGGEEPVQLDAWHEASPRQADRRDVRQRAVDALQGLQRLLADYMDETQPFLPLDHGQRERRAGEYDHLNRWREWLPLLTSHSG